MFDPSSVRPVADEYRRGSYKDGMSSTITSRLSNSYLIGEIFGMLFFGALIDRVGRRAGVVAATIFFILGVVLATAAHGTSQLGYVRQRPTTERELIL